MWFKSDGMLGKKNILTQRTVLSATELYFENCYVNETSLHPIHAYSSVQTNLNNTTEYKSKETFR